MAEVKKNVMTREGLKKYEDELNELKVNKRREISQKIKEAREQGDLSENAEYDAAKEEQTEVEKRIEYLQDLLKNAEVRSEEDTEKGVIDVGSRVTVLDVEFDETLEYRIVGPSEANILQGLISNESPLGKALKDKKVGNKVKVDTPTGEVVTYKILKVE